MTRSPSTLTSETQQTAVITINTGNFPVVANDDGINVAGGMTARGLVLAGAWAALLLEDLRFRTGLPVKRCEVSNINFLRDTAEIRIYYDDPAKTGSSFSWLENELGIVGENGRFVDEHL